ncbi:MAG: hypothetical protein KC620_05430 [Myxococcales bacterium]|nr:hypothetical protein [Myxococcales bacterium]
MFRITTTSLFALALLAGGCRFPGLDIPEEGPEAVEGEIGGEDIDLPAPPDREAIEDCVDACTEALDAALGACLGGGEADACVAAFEQGADDCLSECGADALPDAADLVPEMPELPELPAPPVDVPDAGCVEECFAAANEATAACFDDPADIQGCLDGINGGVDACLAGCGVPAPGDLESVPVPAPDDFAGPGACVDDCVGGAEAALHECLADGGAEDCFDAMDDAIDACLEDCGVAAGHEPPEGHEPPPPPEGFAPPADHECVDACMADVNAGVAECFAGGGRPDVCLSALDGALEGCIDDCTVVDL